MIVVVNFAAWDMVALSVTILILESEHVGVLGLGLQVPSVKGCDGSGHDTVKGVLFMDTLSGI